MRGALGEAAKLLRLADSQLRQAVELVHPGPVAGLYSPEERAAAARRVGRAVDAWWARHGGRQGARAAPPPPPPPPPLA